MIIDDEINRISTECIERVQKLIEEKKDLIETLKVKLLEKESLNHNDIKEILGERPFASTNENYQKYVMEEQKAHEQNLEQEGELLKQ
jgi:AFG3 family protein